MQIVAVTDPMQLGFYRQAMIGIRVSGDVREIADRLGGAARGRLRGAHRRQFDLLVEVVCENDDDLIELLNAEIRTLPGVAVDRDVRLPEAPQAVLQLGYPLGTGSPRRGEIMTVTDQLVPGSAPLDAEGAALQQKAAATTSGCTSPARACSRSTACRSSSAARATTSGTDRGKQYIDGLSGLFVVNAGHGRRRLAEAAAKQAERARVLPDLVVRAPLRHRPRRPARRRGARRPEPRVLLAPAAARPSRPRSSSPSTTGSSSASPTKHKVISRAVAYHGTPHGALAHHRHPGDEGDVRAAHARRVPGAEHELSTAPRRWAHRRIRRRSAAGPPTASRSMILFEGPETVAAVFLEPVQNAGGCFPPPPGYFQRVRADLRQVRRAARLRRGHLRVRPHRRDLRLRRLRLRARHDHLREGA